VWIVFALTWQTLSCSTVFSCPDSFRAEAIFAKHSRYCDDMQSVRRSFHPKIPIQLSSKIRQWRLVPVISQMCPKRAPRWIFRDGLWWCCDPCDDRRSTAEEKYRRSSPNCLTTKSLANTPQETGKLVTCEAAPGPRVCGDGSDALVLQLYRYKRRSLRPADLTSHLRSKESGLQMQSTRSPELSLTFLHCHGSQICGVRDRVLGHK